MLSPSSRRAVPAALLAAAALGGPLADAADAARAIDERTFRVEVKAVQRTTWTLDYRARERCDYSKVGSGRETVVLTTRRPRPLTFKTYGTGYLVIGDRNEIGGQDLDVWATVDRDTRVALTPNFTGTECGDNDGSGGPPPAPDCGRRRTTYEVRVDYETEPRPGFVFGEPELPHLPEPLYSNCRWASGVPEYPNLVRRDARERMLLAPLPLRELMDRRIGKLILIERATRRWRGDGLVGTTRVRWELSLTQARRGG